jgi:hypothetical protein
LSFISNAFGASNGFTPGGGNASQAALQQAATTNYNNANVGLNQLAQQLQAQAQGQGPNLANQQLQNFTGQNVANQAALMAGQRGSSANPGLIARQAAQVGAGAQQTAAGQAAQNVLQQQLAAQQQLGGLYGTQIQGANQAYSGVQSGINASNQIGSQEAQQNASTAGGILGGIGNAAGAALGNISGLNPTQAYSNSYAEGGEIEPLRAKLPNKHPSIPEHLQHIAAIRYPRSLNMAEGGKAESVPVKVSPGERILNPSKAKDVKDGKADPIKASKPVPGKAKVSGDSYANDTVPKNVKAGSIVLPRSVTQHHNAPQAAFDFVSKVQAGHHKSKKDKKDG